jgi:hypothetical protein
MPQNAAKKEGRTKPPGGRRVSASEVQRRLDAVDEMLRAGKTRAEVVESMVRAFGLAPRSADSYIARARERWAEESKGDREVARTAALARLDRLSGKAEDRGAFGAAVAAEKLKAQVSGLFAPQQLDVRAAVVPAAPPEDEMSEQTIGEELAAVAALLARMITAGEVEATPDLVSDVRTLAEAVGLVGVHRGA